MRKEILYYVGLVITIGSFILKIVLYVHSDQGNTPIRHPLDTNSALNNLPQKEFDKYMKANNHLFLFMNCLEDSTSEPYYVNIIKNNKVDIYDELKLKNLANFLLSENSNKEYYFFKVFTCTMNEPNEKYLMLLGENSKQYLETKPYHLFDFLFNTHQIKEDRSNWITYIMKGIKQNTNSYDDFHSTLLSIKKNTIKTLKNTDIELLEVSLFFNEIESCYISEVGALE